AVTRRHDLESCDTDLAGLAAAVADFQPGEPLFDSRRVELQHHVLADLDSPFLQERGVRFLATGTLPEEVEAIVLLPGSVALARVGAGEVRDVQQLVIRGDDGELDLEGVELPGVFLGRLSPVEDDAPALFARNSAVARPES